MGIHVGFDVLLEGLPGAPFLLGKGDDIDIYDAIKLLSAHLPDPEKEGENDNDTDTVSHVQLFSLGESSELGKRLVFMLRN